MLSWVVMLHPEPRMVSPHPRQASSSQHDLSLHPCLSASLPPFKSSVCLPPRFFLHSTPSLFSLCALSTKSVSQLFGNQSLPHSFLKQPGGIGLSILNVVPSFSISIETRHTMDPETPNPNSPNDSPRCQHRTPTGRRCRHSISDAAAGLCSKHLKSRQHYRQEADLSATLLRQLTELSSACDINKVPLQSLPRPQPGPHCCPPRRRSGLHRQSTPPYPPRHGPRNQRRGRPRQHHHGYSPPRP
jgi:hypothetical protein